MSSQNDSAAMPHFGEDSDGPVGRSANVPSSRRVLRRLFLTLFLRGRSSRGLRKEGAPRTVGSKLSITLLLYAAIGCVAFMFLRQPIFALSLYLHAMTLVFLGMFIAASAGEVLFNREEADILLHRPVTPRALLWAKIGVLVEVSLWLAGAFNLAGLLVGAISAQGTLFFPLVHLASSVFEALFCTGCVVLTYQLCLRWFGRERLEGLMTMVQVIVSIAAVVGGQVVPQLLGRFGTGLVISTKSWWLALLPPAWFAGLDDAVAGSRAVSSWFLGIAGVTATAIVLWFAFGKLAGVYETGLQMLGEVSSPKRSGRQRWLPVLINAPPLRWWLRSSVERASFLLAAAYLLRDRETKLRIYPGLAPMLVMPIIFLIQEHRPAAADGGSGFGVAFSGGYLGLIPLLALNLLQYSQHWQAADIFRAAPIEGPGPLCHGARRAVLCFVALPLTVALGFVAWFLRGRYSHLLLLLPGIVALPVYALLPTVRGKAVPLSLPNEEARAAKRGLSMLAVIPFCLAIAWLATWSLSGGWFWWMLLGEAAVVTLLYAGLRASMRDVRWPSLE